jgi:hypothetical protein
LFDGIQLMKWATERSHSQYLDALPPEYVAGVHEADAAAGTLRKPGHTAGGEQVNVAIKHLEACRQLRD